MHKISELDIPSTSTDHVYPWFSMVALSIGMLAHSCIFTSALPFVAFMVVDFKMSPDVDSAGYYAGWITGCFMIGRVIAAVPWGMLADRIGRRPCLLASMINIAVFGICFGLSSSFTMALLARLCIGLGNGFMAVAKTVISEITTCKEHEIRAFGLINGIWGLGLIVGPAVGGLLARPAIQYPKLFSPTGLWAVYPYLLPSLICSLIALVALIFVYISIPETLVKRSVNRDYDSIAVISSHGLIEAESEHSSNHINCSSTESGDLCQEDHIELTDSENTSLDNDTIINFLHDHHHQQQQQLDDMNIEISEGLPSTTEEDDEGEGDRERKKPSTFAELFVNKHVRVIFLVYISQCFIVMFVDESFPLWAVTSRRQGGLAWTAAQVGEMLAITGFSLILFQVFLYERFMRSCCNMHVSRQLSMMDLASASLIFTLPIVATAAMATVDANKSLNSDTSVLVVQCSIMSILVVYRVFATAGFSTLGLAVNSCVEKEMRGTLNGIMMAGGSLGNGMGPIVGGALYATLATGQWNTGNNPNSAFPIDGRVIFTIGSILMISLAVVCRYCLKET